MAQLYTVASLWIGPELSWIEQICLSSFVRNGHQTILYTYEHVKGIPDGIEVRDAREIMPERAIIYHKMTGSPAFQSDIFRLLLLSQTDYLWIDTDALCVKPFEKPDNGYFFGWGTEKTPMLFTGVLGLPHDSEILREMMNLTTDEYPIPPWLPKAQQDRLSKRKAAGNGLHVSEMKWGIWGPDALDYFAKKTGECEHAFAGHVLYPLPFRRANWLYWPNYLEQVHDYIKPDTLSVHFYGRRLRNIMSHSQGQPLAGSYIADLIKDYDIDPMETSHLFERKQPLKDAAAKAALKLPSYDTYDEMLACDAWQNALESLNAQLVKLLNDADAAPELNGNLFYSHKDPKFEGSELVPQFDGKRRNLFKLAKDAKHMLEVGVNGGHSLFLALSANPKLRVTGIDICRQVVPSWARVDVYVPGAFDWLSKAFPKRCSFITGNSLIELPRYTDENPKEKIDLLHLDGAKDTHLREFLAIRPLMRKGAVLLQDDTNTKPVRTSMRQIQNLGYAVKPSLDDTGLLEIPGHKILYVT